MRIINDRKIKFYKIYNLIFDFVNNKDKKRINILKPYIIDILKYDLIFDYFQIYNIDFNIYQGKEF